MRFTGLDESQLVRWRLEQRPRSATWTSTSGPGSRWAGAHSRPATRLSRVQLRVEADLRALLDKVVAADHPFLGACYGIGTLGVHQGAVVDRKYGEPVGAVTVTLTAEGRADPLLGAPGVVRGVRRAQGGGQPAAAARGAAGELAGLPRAAFRVGRNVYATQLHPELDPAGLRTRLGVYRDAGYFAPQDADRLIGLFAFEGDRRAGPGARAASRRCPRVGPAREQYRHARLVTEVGATTPSDAPGFGRTCATTSPATSRTTSRLTRRCLSSKELEQQGGAPRPWLPPVDSAADAGRQ